MNNLLMAPIGTKVRVKDSYWASEYFRKDLLQLNVNENGLFSHCTLSNVRIGTFSSQISLEEIPGHRFACVAFEPIEDFIPVSEEEYQSRITYKLG